MLKSLQMKQDLEALKNEAKALLENKDAKLEDIQAKSKEMEMLQAKIVIQEQIEADAKAAIADVEPEKTPDEPGIENAIKNFANAARQGFKVANKMTEGSNPDGGYTVPEDILTKINKYRSAKRSLIDLVTVVPVTTDKGQRTFKKRSQQTGFIKVGEGGKIGAKATPQFERIAYDIDKYAGYFPVTNELLNDSDANIVTAIVEWIADESRVTRNKLILEEIAKLTPVELKGLDDIKKILNVTLGQAFKPTSKIITNDDGLQYLDTLKNATGEYLLQPNPADPMTMRLCAGATTIPVEVIPNDDLPTTTNKIPFIIGDLKEGVVFWDREKVSIKMSDIAAIGDLNAYEEDLTLFRAIEREDVTARDGKAMVNGFITVTP